MSTFIERKPLLILKLVIVVMLSFILTAIVYETIEYLSMTLDSFHGDKFAETPEKLYKMRVFTLVYYSGLIVYPAYQLSLLFFHVFTGYKAGKIVYLYQIFISILLALAFFKGFLNSLSIYISGGIYLGVHSCIVFCYFSCGFTVMSFLLPSSRLRRSIKVRYCRRIQRYPN